MSTVYVTNRGDLDHTDWYHGVFYHFRKGETIEMPSEAAQELLGYGHRNREPFVVRLGWSVTSNDMPKAMERLNRFEISPTPPEQNRVLPSSVGVVTPLSERRAGRKATRAA
jgi:hypothetical protein